MKAPCLDVQVGPLAETCVNCGLELAGRPEENGPAPWDAQKRLVPEKATAVGRAFRSFFSGEVRPASSWVGVQALADPGFLVEVEATAVFD